MLCTLGNRFENRCSLYGSSLWVRIQSGSIQSTCTEILPHSWRCAEILASFSMADHNPLEFAIFMAASINAVVNTEGLCWPHGEEHAVCVPWGPKQLLDWLKRTWMTPSCPPTPHPWQARWQKGRGGEPTMVLLSPAISSAVPSLALFFRPPVIKTSQ